MLNNHTELTNAEVIWEGDSLGGIRSYPVRVRMDFGAELRRLQTGQKPINSRPMKSLGPRIFEIKEQDWRTWYRIIYLGKVHNRIYVLHCFKKQSRKTAKHDLVVAKIRLKKVLERILEEKKDERKFGK